MGFVGTVPSPYCVCQLLLELVKSEPVEDKTSISLLFRICFAKLYSLKTLDSLYFIVKFSLKINL